MIETTRVPRESETVFTKTLLITGFHKYGRRFSHVTPAKAGVQKSWIPASAGMTKDDSDEQRMRDRTCETVH
jgi:hypothetical protein